MKKALVIGVILLFIGLSVTSSISGNIEKKSNQSTEKVATSFSLNDGLLAYWKSDECNGTTLWDCSGNNYNGTIYGNSWAPGSCLVFNGVDDYVDFDNHSVGLGFNKTDDLNFSFDFKSSTNQKGMIYSMSSDSGTNPEFHIFLDSNGSIGVEIYVINCGFELFANGSYNDNNWHYVEVWYNGIVTKPKVDIYVDGELVAHAEKYVCDFSNDEFDMVKIGRRSHNQTEFFNGIIDEFKIIKYEGGNGQEPPEIDGPTHGDPGVEYEFSFTTYDPEGDDIWIKIDWGDKNITDWLGPYKSGEPVNVSHKWIEEGKYFIRAKSKDYWDDSFWSDPYPILIGGPHIFPPTIDGPKYGDPGVEYNYTFVTESIQGYDLYYFIEWGDGNDTGWLGPYPSGEEITRSHSWSENGTYGIIAKAKDIFDHESDWSYPYFIRIGDYETYEIDIDGPTRGKPGITYYYNFSIDGYEGDALHLHICWGDGTYNSKGYESGQNVTIGHYWEEKGTYGITVFAESSWGLIIAWGELLVTMPRYKIFTNSLLLWFLEQYPIIQRLFLGFGLQ